MLTKQVKGNDHDIDYEHSLVEEDGCNEDFEGSAVDKVCTTDSIGNSGCVAWNSDQSHKFVTAGTVHTRHEVDDLATVSIGHFFLLAILFLALRSSLRNNTRGILASKGLVVDSGS